MATDEQKLRLVQLTLFMCATDYEGSTDGTVTEDDRSEVETVIQAMETGGITGDDADHLILALLVSGYNDNLVDDGVAGPELAIALRKAFGIPEPTPPVLQ